jgi:FkbM family methyltransferase
MQRAMKLKCWGKTNHIRKDYPLVMGKNGVLFNFDLANPLHRGWYVDLGCSSVETLFYKRVLKPGDVVIDVGANVGYMTAIFASIVGKNGQVHSFEPVPKLHSKLEMLAKDNNNKNYNIITNPCAVGDTNGTITINVLKEGADYGTSSVVPGLRKEENIKEKIEVPVVKLDDYAKEQKLTKVSFVKIDVEGFEFPVLRGMELILKQFKPIILCEIMPAAYSLLDSNVNNLLEHMGWFNYKCYKLDINFDRLKEIRSWNFNEVTTEVIFAPKLIRAIIK